MALSFKAILWDMDGTLVDSEPTHGRALEAAMDELGLAHEEDMHDRFVGLPAEAVYNWLVESKGLSLPFQEWIALKYRGYLSMLHDVSPIPASVAFWHQMHAAGVGQAVASNSDRIIVQANLSQADLIRPGLVSVSRNDVRVGKPDPEIYLRAALLLGVAPEDTLVMEDSPTGAKAGLAAGMRTYFVPASPEQAPEGVIQLTSFETLLEE